ncbi:MAG: hypothetical protein HY075_03025 [Deltaproteobacteria bacterium]|nr:hypothetical protein [Deltaproteobacteria bacterium]
MPKISKKRSTAKRSPGKTKSSKRSVKSRSRNEPTRELLSDIAKVGRKLRTRVKRAL